MSAEKSHVVDQRGLTRGPQHADRPRVHSTREYTEAAEDIRSTLRSKEDRLRCAHTLISRRAIQQIELSQSWMQADEDGIRLQAKSVTHHIMPAWKIQNAMGCDCFLNCSSVVSFAVADNADRMHIHPLIRARQWPDRRRHRGGHTVQSSCLIAHPYLSHRT